MHRGFTLIELMITVALVGIASGLSSFGVLENRRMATAAVQQERALQLLEAEADAVMRGQPLEPGTRARLLEELPSANLETRREGELSVLAVSWQSPRGPRRTELAVV